MESKKYNILVTGVGAIIGYGIIKSLRSLNESTHIVGMDIYEDAIGQQWCDKFVQAKYAADLDYIDFLKQIIDENKIDMVFFGTEQEIYKVNQCLGQMEGYCEKVVVNKSELLALSKDKWATYNFLLENGLGKYAISSVIQGDYNEISALFGPAFLLKPRSSYASKGIAVVDNEADFIFYKQKMGDNFMAQELIGDIDHEYTVGVFGLGDGSYSSCICMRRKLSQEGATAKAEVIVCEELEMAVKNLVKQFKPIGPTNLQFRLHKGTYLLLEINPRISSSTSIRTAFGYNEAEMCLKYFLEKVIVIPEIKRGFATRYIDEVIQYI